MSPFSLPAVSSARGRGAAAWERDATPTRCATTQASLHLSGRKQRSALRAGLPIHGGQGLLGPPWSPQAACGPLQEHQPSCLQWPVAGGGHLQCAERRAEQTNCYVPRPPRGATSLQYTPEFHSSPARQVVPVQLLSRWERSLVPPTPPPSRHLCPQ